MNIAPLPRRSIEEADRNRLKILEIVYSFHPGWLTSGINISPESIEGRINISDINYLYEAGFLDVKEAGGLGMPFPVPAMIKLTSAGLDLLMNPQELEREFPTTVSVSNVGGNVIIGNRNSITSITHSLELVRNALSEKSNPTPQESSILDHVNALLADPTFNTVLGAILGSALQH
jgi:hypothetical protein